MIDGNGNGGLGAGDFNFTNLLASANDREFITFFDSVIRAGIDHVDIEPRIVGLYGGREGTTRRNWLR